MSQPSISLKWLAYTFLIGLSANACFSRLVFEQLSFSLFPFLTLFLSTKIFYDLYISDENNEASVRPAWISLLLGMSSYAAFLGASLPELGSNFIAISITLVLAIWLMYKVMFGDKHYPA